MFFKKSNILHNSLRLKFNRSRNIIITFQKILWQCVPLTLCNLFRYFSKASDTLTKIMHYAEFLNKIFFYHCSIPTRNGVNRHCTGNRNYSGNYPKSCYVNWRRTWRSTAWCVYTWHIFSLGNYKSKTY